MTEKELGKALLNLDAGVTPAAPSPPDPRVMTLRILERDRRWVRVLTGVTILAWLLAVGQIMFLLLQFGFLLPEQARLRRDLDKGKGGPAQREPLEQWERQLDLAFKKALVMITLAVGVLSMAALSTVLLVLASRRATLRQVNANLVEISEQLKQLRQPPTK